MGGTRPARWTKPVVCWTDADLKPATPETAHTRTMIGNAKALEKDTKAAAGERVLPPPGPALEALKCLRAVQRVRRRLRAAAGGVRAVAGCISGARPAPLVVIATAPSRCMH